MLIFCTSDYYVRARGNRQNAYGKPIIWQDDGSCVTFRDYFLIARCGERVRCMHAKTVSGACFAQTSAFVRGKGAVEGAIKTLSDRNRIKRKLYREESGNDKTRQSHKKNRNGVESMSDTYR